MRIVISILAMAGVALGMVFLIQAQESSRREALKATYEQTANSTSSTSQSSGGSLPAASNGAIPWQKDLDRALSMAKANHSKIVVDVYTDWCGWCKKMDQAIYTDPKVVALSSRFVFLKLNAEDGGQGEQFARKMDVGGYPTTIIIDENGRSLHSVAGYPPSVQNFIDTIEGSR